MKEFLRAVRALDITVVQLNMIIPETLSFWDGRMECVSFTDE